MEKKMIQTWEKPLMQILVEEQTFEGQRILLDGHFWKNCKYNNCQFVVESSEFSMTGCGINGCGITVKGAAANLVKLLKLFYPDLPVIEESSDSEAGIPGVPI